MPELVGQILDVSLGAHAGADLALQLRCGGLLAKVLLQAFALDALPLACLVVCNPSFELFGPYSLFHELPQQALGLLLCSLEQWLQLRRSPNVSRMARLLQQVCNSSLLRLELACLALEPGLNACKTGLEFSPGSLATFQRFALGDIAGLERCHLVLELVALLIRARQGRELHLHVRLQLQHPLLEIVSPAPLDDQVRLALLCVNTVLCRTLLQVSAP
mmetsp:Transcript_59477/g.166720  ORF Transcript_59477/g.166720 Transcript_59477/m.166720 type:complete len:218 (+) Transcript_59477:1375-2028(+)